MSRALLVIVSLAVCLFVAACTKEPSKPPEKATTDQPTSPKKDHDHAKHDGDHDDHAEDDPHAPSKVPLKIVEDVVAASGGHVKESFANEHARVLAIDLHHGDELPLHKSGPSVWYALSDLNLKITDVHGDHTHAGDVEYSAGQTHAQSKGAHGVANLADDDAEYVVFIRKDGDAFNVSAPAGAKSLTDATKYATTLLKGSDDFRVYKVALPRGEKVDEHFALNRLIYALDDAKLKFTDAAGKADVQDLKQGEVRFYSAASSTLANSGESMAKFLVIELKR